MSVFRTGTYNEEGKNVDLYIPRKCSATNQLIRSYDHAAVQIAIANVNSKGVADGTTTTFVLSGAIREQGRADAAINHLAIESGIIRIRTGRPPKVRAAAGKKRKGQKQPAKGAAAGAAKGQKPTGKGAAAGAAKGGKKPAAPAKPQARPKKGAAPARRPKA